MHDFRDRLFMHASSRTNDGGRTRSEIGEGLSAPARFWRGGALALSLIVLIAVFLVLYFTAASLGFLTPDTYQRSLEISGNQAASPVVAGAGDTVFLLDEGGERLVTWDVPSRVFWETTFAGSVLDGRASPERMSVMQAVNGDLFLASRPPEKGGTAEATIARYSGPASFRQLLGLNREEAVTGLINCSVMPAGVPKDWKWDDISDLAFVEKSRFVYAVDGRNSMILRYDLTNQSWSAISTEGVPVRIDVVGGNGEDVVAWQDSDGEVHCEPLVTDRNLKLELKAPLGGKWAVSGSIFPVKGGTGVLETRDGVVEIGEIRLPGAKGDSSGTTRRTTTNAGSEAESSKSIDRTYGFGPVALFVPYKPTAAFIAAVLVLAAIIAKLWISGAFREAGQKSNAVLILLLGASSIYFILAEYYRDSVVFEPARFICSYLSSSASAWALVPGAVLLALCVFFSLRSRMKGARGAGARQGGRVGQEDPHDAASRMLTARVCYAGLSLVVSFLLPVCAKFLPSGFFQPEANAASFLVPSPLAIGVFQALFAVIWPRQGSNRFGVRISASLAAFAFFWMLPSGMIGWRRFGQQQKAEASPSTAEYVTLRTANMNPSMFKEVQHVAVDYAKDDHWIVFGDGAPARYNTRERKWTWAADPMEDVEDLRLFTDDDSTMLGLERGGRLAMYSVEEGSGTSVGRMQLREKASVAASRFDVQGNRLVAIALDENGNNSVRAYTVKPKEGGLAETARIMGSRLVGEGGPPSVRNADVQFWATTELWTVYAQNDRVIARNNTTADYTTFLEENGVVTGGMVDGSKNLCLYATSSQIVLADLAESTSAVVAQYPAASPIRLAAASCTGNALSALFWSESAMYCLQIPDARSPAKASFRALPMTLNGSGPVLSEICQAGQLADDTVVARTRTGEMWQYTTQRHEWTRIGGTEPYSFISTGVEPFYAIGKDGSVVELSRRLPASVPLAAFDAGLAQDLLKAPQFSGSGLSMDAQKSSYKVAAGNAEQQAKAFSLLNSLGYAVSWSPSMKIPPRSDLQGLRGTGSVRNALRANDLLWIADRDSLYAYSVSTHSWSAAGAEGGLAMLKNPWDANGVVVWDGSRITQYTCSGSIISSKAMEGKFPLRPASDASLWYADGTGQWYVREGSDSTTPKALVSAGFLDDLDNRGVRLAAHMPLVKGAEDLVIGSDGSVMIWDPSRKTLEPIGKGRLRMPPRASLEHISGDSGVIWLVINDNVIQGVDVGRSFVGGPQPLNGRRILGSAGNDLYLETAVNGETTSIERLAGSGIPQGESSKTLYEVSRPRFKRNPEWLDTPRALLAIEDKSIRYLDKKDLAWHQMAGIDVGTIYRVVYCKSALIVWGAKGVTTILGGRVTENPDLMNLVVSQEGISATRRPDVKVSYDPTTDEWVPSNPAAAAQAPRSRLSTRAIIINVLIFVGIMIFALISGNRNSSGVSFFIFCVIGIIIACIVDFRDLRSQREKIREVGLVDNGIVAIFDSGSYQKEMETAEYRFTPDAKQPGRFKVTFQAHGRDVEWNASFDAENGFDFLHQINEIFASDTGGPLFKVGETVFQLRDLEPRVCPFSGAAAPRGVERGSLVQPIALSGRPESDAVGRGIADFFRPYVADGALALNGSLYYFNSRGVYAWSLQDGSVRSISDLRLQDIMPYRIADGATRGLCRLRDGTFADLDPGTDELGKMTGGVADLWNYVDSARDSWTWRINVGTGACQAADARGIPIAFSGSGGFDFDEVREIKSAQPVGDAYAISESGREYLLDFGDASKSYGIEPEKRHSRFEVKEKAVDSGFWEWTVKTGATSDDDEISITFKTLEAAGRTFRLDAWKGMKAFPFDRVRDLRVHANALYKITGLGIASTPFEPGSPALSAISSAMRIQALPGGAAGREARDVWLYQTLAGTELCLGIVWDGYTAPAVFALGKNGWERRGLQTEEKLPGAWAAAVPVIVTRNDLNGVTRFCSLEGGGAAKRVDVIENRLSFELPLKVFIGDGFIQVLSADGISTYPMDGATGKLKAQWIDFIPFTEGPGSSFERRKIVESGGVSSKPVTGDPASKRCNYLGASDGRLKWIEADVFDAPIETLAESKADGVIGDDDGDMVWLRVKGSGIRPYVKCRDLRSDRPGQSPDGFLDSIGGYAAASVSAKGFSFDCPQNAVYTDGCIILSAPFARSNDAVSSTLVEAGRCRSDGSVDWGGFDFSIVDGALDFASTRVPDGPGVKTGLLGDPRRQLRTLRVSVGNGAVEVRTLQREDAISVGVENGLWSWNKVYSRGSDAEQRAAFKTVISSLSGGEERVFNRTRGGFLDNVCLSIGVASQAYGTLVLAANCPDGRVKRYFFSEGVLSRTTLEQRENNASFTLQERPAWYSGARTNRVEIAPLSADDFPGWEARFVSSRR